MILKNTSHKHQKLAHMKLSQQEHTLQIGRLLTVRRRLLVVDNCQWVSARQPAPPSIYTQVASPSHGWDLTGVLSTLDACKHLHVCHHQLATNTHVQWSTAVILQTSCQSWSVREWHNISPTVHYWPLGWSPPKRETQCSGQTSKFQPNPFKQFRSRGIPDRQADKWQPHYHITTGRSSTESVQT